MGKTAQDIIDYVNHTPQNSNPNVLRSLLGQMEGQGGGLPEVSGSGRALVSVDGQWVEQEGYGYLKLGRTLYEKVFTATEEEEEGVYGFMDSVSIKGVVDQTYSITFDGVEFECKGIEFDETMVTIGAPINAEEGTFDFSEFPFSIWLPRVSYISSNMIVFCPNTSEHSLILCDDGSMFTGKIILTSSEEDDELYYGEAEEETAIRFEPNVTYDINWQGKKYSITAISTGSFMRLGELDSLGEMSFDNYPFFIYIVSARQLGIYAPKEQDEPDIKEVTLQIKTSGQVVPFDAKYIPNNSYTVHFTYDSIDETDKLLEVEADYDLATLKSLYLHGATLNAELQTSETTTLLGTLTCKEVDETDTWTFYFNFYDFNPGAGLLWRIVYDGIDGLGGEITEVYNYGK